jgi:hypothetical protein
MVTMNRNPVVELNNAIALFMQVRKTWQWHYTRNIITTTSPAKKGPTEIALLERF